MKKIIIFSLMAIALVACDPQQTALDDLETFTARIEQKSATWSLAEWDDALQQFNEITQSLERYNYTDEELQHIGHLEGRCTAYFVAHYATQFEEQAHDALQEFQGALEGFLDVLGN
ncbi:MAG: hypothetical protein ACI392_07050 [Paludibacteraceae bacterium]